jgi:hypothetical protein
MRRIVGIGAAWIAATLVAVVVATAAVGSVRSEVTNAPTALAAPLVAASETAPAPDSETSTTTTTSVVPAAPTTTMAITVSTTTTTVPETHASGEAPVTTTTPPVTPTTATTTTTSSNYAKTYDTEAGSVRITVSGESVTFAGATPLPGWTVELEHSGPEEVKVNFERNEHEDEEKEIEFKATVEDGELRISISEES